jgi:TrmH family RNA methyltransferase
VVLAAESAKLPLLPGVRIVVLPDALLEKISGTETSPGVMALVEPPEWKLEQLFQGRTLVIVLDGLQDPGNAGAVLRAAEAFGATGAIFLKGTASPFNPKTLRASAGSLFRVPFLYGMDAALALAAFEENRVELYAAAPSAARTVAEADLTARCAIVIGNEARGVSRELRAAAQELSIPTVGVESLNAAVAAGILLYEARRQRERRT